MYTKIQSENHYLRGGRMDDSCIIDLFWARSEAAITETDHKYGIYCRSIAMGILCNEADSEECVNDTWLRAWDAIPPARPSALRVFLGRITRNLALDKIRAAGSEKRGGGMKVLIDELRNCLPQNDTADGFTDKIAISQVLNSFLAGLDKKERIIFMRRYWYAASVEEIASDCKMTVYAVKKLLAKSRNTLKEMLEKEDIQP